MNFIQQYLGFERGNSAKDTEDDVSISSHEEQKKLVVYSFSAK